jgi:hypothetical protein
VGRSNNRLAVVEVALVGAKEILPCPAKPYFCRNGSRPRTSNSAIALRIALASVISERDIIAVPHSAQADELSNRAWPRRTSLLTTTAGTRRSRTLAAAVLRSPPTHGPAITSPSAGGQLFRRATRFDDDWQSVLSVDPRLRRRLRGVGAVSTNWRFPIQGTAGERDTDLSARQRGQCVEIAA